MKNIIDYNNGIHLCGTKLWMDASDPQELCFVSHAHMDHVGSHERIIVSKETARLYEHRMPPTTMIVLEYNAPMHIEGLELELIPSGHVLGGAQLLIKKDGMRILYSGDIKLQKNLTCPRIEIREADVLIMEATYGTPDCIFPDRTQVIDEFLSCIHQTLQRGNVPVVFAYSLGKGQEVAKIIGDAGCQMVLHNTIYDLLKIYEEFGVSFSNYEKLGPASTYDQKVLIIPPYIADATRIHQISNKETFLVSGWALNPQRKRMQVDHLIPLSDHADFNELLLFVRGVQPKKIYVTHGTKEFVTHLRYYGYDAVFIGKKK